MSLPTDSELRMLEADARYARDRASLYRARVWSGRRAATTVRLRQLESAAEAAATRVRRATDRASSTPGEGE
jgi:hypothetical protein